MSNTPDYSATFHCPACGDPVFFKLVGDIEWGYDEPRLPTVRMTLWAHPTKDPENPDRWVFHNKDCMDRFGLRSQA